MLTDASVRRRRLETYLTLRAAPGIGRVGLGRLLRESGRASLDEAPAVLWGQLRASLLTDDAALALAAREARSQIDRCEALGIVPWFRGEAGYPSGLGRLADPPDLVFIQGALPQGGVLAVVGTREPSAWGLEQAGAYAAEAARTGLTVLNGLARGVDQAALSAALGAGGPCAGVLACGHDLVGQGGVGLLAGRILAEGGCLASEYAPGVAAHKGSFIERDRIQAGMSTAVLVVESGALGGTMHTARAAAQAGIPVMALLPPAWGGKSGSEARPRAEGAERLIGAGAVHIGSTSQCLDFFKSIKT